MCHSIYSPVVNKQTYKYTRSGISSPDELLLSFRWGIEAHA